MPAIPEISVEALADKLRSGDRFVLLDVREPWELDRAHIVDARLAVAPMSSLAEVGFEGLPAAVASRAAEVFVLCHHGVRSAQVTAWLAANGWARIYSVAGGIEEYARRVDPAVGSY